MNSLFDLLWDMERNPDLFLGNASCEKLAGFIIGWTGAADEFTCPPEDPTLRIFASWLCSKYGISGSYDAFAIVQMVAGDDCRAFYLFFQELINFKGSRPSYFNSGFVFINQRLGPYDRSDIVQKIRRKPALYLGRKTVTRFRGFLDGDAYLRRQVNPAAGLYGDLNAIEKSLNVVYKCNLTIRCEVLALVQCNGDEARAFDWLLDAIDAFEMKSSKP